MESFKIYILLLSSPACEYYSWLLSTCLLPMLARSLFNATKCKVAQLRYCCPSAAAGAP